MDTNANGPLPVEARAFRVHLVAFMWNLMKMRAPAFGIVDTRRVYDWVFSIYVPIAIGVFTLFTLAIIGAAVIYRRRRASDLPPGIERPNARSENNLVEFSYIGLLLCVVGVLLYITFKAEHKTDTAMASERPAYTIDVTASRWLWTFDYPGHHIIRSSGEGANQILVVPANEAVRFNLRSADVIHSLWIPQLDFKRDAIPGGTERLTLDFDHQGLFKGACAEYCGTYHAQMVFSVRVVSNGQFTQWLSSGGRTFS